MIINKTVYTIGNIGSIHDVVALMQSDKCKWEYFVYTTKNEKHPLRIGNFHTLKHEADAVVLGVAPSRRLAYKLSVHIVLKALSFGGGVDAGIKKMIGAC